MTWNGRLNGWFRGALIGSTFAWASSQAPNAGAIP